MLSEIPIGAVRADDVGSRVVVLSDGGTFDGILESIWTSWDKYAKPEPAPTARMTVEGGNAKLELTKLPMDFRIQIERDNHYIHEQGKENA